MPSRQAPPLIIIPFLAAIPIPATTAVGDASATAHGQAIISTVIALIGLPVTIYVIAEIANIDGVRFVKTSTAPSVSNSGSNNSVAEIEQTIILGENASGIARLLPGDFDVVVTQPGGHGDEYKVKTSMAWKCYMKAVILNQSFMRRLESAR